MELRGSVKTEKATKVSGLFCFTVNDFVYLLGVGITGKLVWLSLSVDCTAKK